MADTNQIAQDLYAIIKNYKVEKVSHCLTRLRITFANGQPNDNDIKAIKGVIGVIKSGEEFQIVLGVGVVDQVYAQINDMLANTQTTQAPATVTANTPNNSQNFDEIKKKYRKNYFSQALSKFSKIFAPLIPCFIAAGIITAIATIIQITVPHFNDDNWIGKHNDHQWIVAHQWYSFFTLALSAWVGVFLVMVGWRFNETFNGKPWCGAIMGAMFTSVAGGVYASLHGNNMFLGIPVNSVRWNWFTSGLANFNVDKEAYEVGPPLGSMFGVILACVASIYVERLWSKLIHRSVAFVIVPILTILCLLLINFIVIFPVSGYIVYALSWLFEHITVGQLAPFGDALLAGLYLVLLTFGLSSSLIPIYTLLLNNGGLNTIYPLLGMAGFAQIGAAVALVLSSPKGSNFRKNIGGSIISGFLGIDEPLCYGCSLPRLVPYVTSCIAAACAGFFIGGMQAWVGIDMGVNMVYGVDGIWGIFTTTSKFHNNPLFGKMVYCIGIGISMVCGFLFCRIGYRIFKNNKKVNWNLE